MAEAKAKTTTGEAKVKAITKEVKVSVGDKVFLLTLVAPKNTGKHKFDRYQPEAGCKELAPFSVVYVPK